MSIIKSDKYLLLIFAIILSTIIIIICNINSSTYSYNYDNYDRDLYNLVI